MPDGGSQPTRPPRTWRPIILWTTGILAAMGLAWFAGTAAVSLHETRQVDRILDRLDVIGYRVNDVLASQSIRYREASASDLRAAICIELSGGEPPPPNVPVVEPAASALTPGQREATAGRLSRYLALPDKRAPRRIEAIYVLSICGRSGVTALTRALHEASPEVRCAAAWALGEVGPAAAQATADIESLLHDPDEDVRTAAERALAHIRNRPPGQDR